MQRNGLGVWFDGETDGVGDAAVVDFYNQINLLVGTTSQCGYQKESNRAGIGNMG